MKSGHKIFLILIIVLSACKDNDVNVFKKSADERVAEAIASLKADLTAPANGWILKYQPEITSGSYNILMKFKDDNHVTISTDAGSNNGEFQEQTITYRIDSSLDIELILETYSFFSYLFEQDNATFGAEYEFIYVSKPSDNILVFRSKTDYLQPTQLIFEKATSISQNLLNKTIGSNLHTLTKDLKEFRSDLSLTNIKLSYDNKDLAFYAAVDELKRLINFTAVFKKTDTLNTQEINLVRNYLIEGDSIIFNTPIKGTFLGNIISFKSIRLNSIYNTALTNYCTDPLPIHAFAGTTSANDNIKLQTTLIDIEAGNSLQSINFLFSPLEYIFNKNESAATDIETDLQGVLSMQLYYNYDIGDDEPFYGIGFVIQNPNNDDVTYALREFTPIITGNNIKFNFKPDFTFFGAENSNININNMNKYLNFLTEGDHTFIYLYDEYYYEFYNPCNGWRFVFINL